MRKGLLLLSQILLAACGGGKASVDARIDCPGPYSSTPCVTGAVCEYRSPLTCEPGCSGGSYSRWECVDGKWQDTMHTAGGPSCYCSPSDARVQVDGRVQSDVNALDASAGDLLNTTLDASPVDVGNGRGGPTACSPGAACTDLLTCSSGDDVDLGCRSFLVCKSGTLEAAYSFIRCGAAVGSACSTGKPQDGAACDVHGQTCSYSLGTCTCATGCEGGADAGPCDRPMKWHCGPPSSGSCPSRAPQLGAPCGQTALTCGYGSNCYQYQVTCRKGHWEPSGSLPFGGCQ
jgi:hypothetical protein